jgi:fatty-acyl-CoA synthase
VEIEMSKITKSYICGEGSQQLIYNTIGNKFEEIVNQFPNNDALVVCHQDIKWSYKLLNEKIDELATGLLSLGLIKGDRLGIWGPNSYEWVLTQLATAKIGVIMVCINPAYRLFELEYALNKVECKAIISAESFKSSQYLSMLNELAPELKNAQPGQLNAEKLPYLTTVIRMGENKTSGMYNFNAICQAGGKKEQKQLNKLRTTLQPDDPINIQFTSGTTGRPKGATLTHCNILNNGSLCADGMNFTDKDRLCIPIPLYHCFGMVLGVLACVSHGATMVFPSEAFEPLKTLQAIEKEKCTALHGVPTMFIVELDHPEFDNYDVSSLRTGMMAGATCPIELMKRLIEKMNLKDILIGYGQTETSPLNHITKPDDSLENRTQTVGKAVPYIEIKVINEFGYVCELNEPGEICIRGYSVMKGYWGDEEKTRDTIDDAGWLHSGDIATMDEDGYVKITGRIKDMIIRGGENIYPREIEEFLYNHPKISEVQVFGILDEKMGEEVCAWIQLKEGEDCTSEEIIAFCKGQVAHFKIPLHIDFVTEYPMTITGKIQKFKMKKIKQEELTSGK